MKPALKSLITLIIILSFQWPVLSTAVSNDMPSSEHAATPEEVVKAFYPDSPTAIDSWTGLRNEVSPILMCLLASENTEKRMATIANFTKPLADFFLKERKAPKGDPIHFCIDFDPTIGGQDYAITEFEIEPAVIKDGQAKVTVRFVNFHQPTTIIYHLQKKGDSWLIDDIEGELYKLKDYVAACQSDQ